MSTKNSPPKGFGRDHCSFGLIYRTVGGFDFREDDDDKQPLLPWRILQRQDGLEFLVIYQWWLKKLQTKLPGGTKKELSDGKGGWIEETPFETLQREVLGEVGLVAYDHAIEDHLMDKKEGYDRYFFLIEYAECGGKIRDYELSPNDPEYDTEIEGLPEWKSLADVVKELHPSHLNQFKELVLGNKKLADLAQHLLFQLESE